MAEFLLSPIISIKEARQAAVDALVSFYIYKEDGTPIVNGLLKNKPVFSLTSEYDRLINMDGAFANVNKGLSLIGKTIGTNRFWSRQIFKGGSYLNIAIETRFLNETTDVVSEVKKLVGLCVPKALEESSAAEADTEYEDNKNPASVIANQFLGAGNTPPPIGIQISTYFGMSGFVMKGVEWTFSHEQNTNGPLYADVKMELMQLEIQQSDTIQKSFGITTGITKKPIEWQKLADELNKSLAELRTQASQSTPSDSTKQQLGEL